MKPILFLLPKSSPKDFIRYSFSHHLEPGYITATKSIHSMKSLVLLLVFMAVFVLSNHTGCLLEFVGVVLSWLAEEGGVGVGRVLPLRPLCGALLCRSGGRLLGRSLDSLLQHAHVFLRQLWEEKQRT